MDKGENKISLRYFFGREKKLLALTAVTGIIYNVGLAAGPLLEGQLAQYLFDILKGRRESRDLAVLSAIYVGVILIVQGARALKRLYVRKFANNVTRSMKERIYRHLLQESCAEIRHEDTGAVMTRAIADAEACAEGMRKFTTEIFDTGVVMIAYLVTLFLLDWRLSLIVCLFPPIAYVVSGALKKKVTVSAAESRKAMSKLNGAALDYSTHALTYRIYGEERNRAGAFENVLTEYERKNVISGIWQNSPQPVYYVISMIGVVPILYFGGKNVLGTGWTVWTIASFSSFLACFTRLATKSSHAAKLFNAVQKAQVSWERIKTYLVTGEDAPSPAAAEPGTLAVRSAGVSYGDGGFSLHDLNLTAEPGEIIGVTGQVASGKSTFGKMFLCEYPHTGKILYGGRELTGSLADEAMIFAYAGHDPELFAGSVRENIAFGEEGGARLAEVLSEVQIDGEVTPDTPVGMEGNELSGGQQARIALARALYSRAPVLILDDPFSAVDADTERKIFRALREKESGRTILLISHRLAMFPETDQVAFLENGTMTAGSHETMMKNKGYAALYLAQR